MKISLLKMLVLGCVFSASAGKSSAADRPNILFAVADDMSHASAYGYTFLSTPNFDVVAEGGILFTHMYTPSSKCAPSRAVMITGRNPWQLEGAANHKPVWPDKFKSVVESLGDHGYFTGFTGKGWNPGIHPKGRDLTGKAFNDVKIKSKELPTRAIAAFDYTANFKQFMAEKPGEQPFFFWYGCKEPHRGYEFKSGVKHGKRFEDLDFLPSFWADTDAVKHDILDYAFEVEYFDRHLGQILAHLEEIGELENTLIVVTSDNGMPFPRYKGHPHEFATRVPFAVKWPGKITEPGRRAEGFFSFIDLAPTFLQVAGVTQEQSGMQPIQGSSLVGVFTGKAEGQDRVLTGRERNDMCRPNGWGYPVRSLHKGRYVYMHNFEPDRWPSGTAEAGFRDTDWGPTKSELVYKQLGTPAFDYCFGKRPQEELYDVVADPECLSNLAGKGDYLALQIGMRNELFAELAAQNDPRAGGDGEIFDQYRPERIPEYDALVQQVEMSKKAKSRK